MTDWKIIFPREAVFSPGVVSRKGYTLPPRLSWAFPCQCPMRTNHKLSEVVVGAGEIPISAVAQLPTSPWAHRSPGAWSTDPHPRQKPPHGPKGQASLRPPECLVRWSVVFLRVWSSGLWWVWGVCGFRNRHTHRPIFLYIPPYKPDSEFSAWRLICDIFALVISHLITAQQSGGGGERSNGATQAPTELDFFHPLAESSDHRWRCRRPTNVFQRPLGAPPSDPPSFSLLPGTLSPSVVSLPPSFTLTLPTIVLHPE